MTVPFVSILADTRVPGVYAEFSEQRSASADAIKPWSVLLVGQRLAAGTVADGVPARITSKEEARTFGGAGSQIARMAAVYFKNNVETETWMVGLSDAGGSAAAAGSFSFTGPTTAAGTLVLYIDGERIALGIAAATAATAVATAVAAAINALPDLPVTAAVDGVNLFEVDITAKNGGTAGNSLDLRVNYYPGEALPAGLAVTIVAMAGGATDPDVTPVAGFLGGQLGEKHYDAFAFGFGEAATRTDIEAELESRWDGTRMIEGVAYFGHRGDSAALLALAATVNSRFLSITGANKSPTFPGGWAAAIAANVARYISADPTRPVYTLPLVGVLAPAEVDRFGFVTQNNLLKAGIGVCNVDASGVVRIGRIVTTRTTDPLTAQETKTWVDVNAPHALGYIRWDWRTYIAGKYGRHKRGEDGVRYDAGQAVLTPKLIEAEAVAKLEDWQRRAIVENVEESKKSLYAEVNASDNTRIDLFLPPNIVNPLAVVGTQIGFFS
jgi:phage tail sheath gpL-like